MGKWGSKWIALLLLEISLSGISAREDPKFSFQNNTVYDVWHRDEMDKRKDREDIRNRRRLFSRTSRRSRGSYTMDSASKRLETNIQSTLPISPGTLWRQSLLHKVFKHTSNDPSHHSKTEVLNSGYHNSFGTHIARALYDCCLNRSIFLSSLMQTAL